MKNQFEVTMLPIKKLKDCPLNPRRTYDKKLLDELTESIKAKGVQDPITVRSVNSHYEVVAGSRRVRAAAAAGLKEIPAFIREFTDEEASQFAIIDNLQREDITPLDEAEGYALLLKKQRGTAEKIAAQIGKPRAYVVQRLKLNALIDPAKKALQSGTLPLGHAILIARLQPKDQQRTFQFAVKTWQQFKGDFEFRNELNPSLTDEKLEQYKDPARTVCSISDLRKFIDERINLDLRAAAFDTKDVELLPKAGACINCPKRTGFNKDLFDDITKGDFCTDADCYGAKQTAFTDRLKATLKKDKKKYQEITRDQRKPDDHPSAITERSFKYVKGKPCKFTRTGIYIDADMKGKTALICSAKKECKQHFGEQIAERKSRSSSGRSGSHIDYETQERQREERTAAAKKRFVPIVIEILKKIPAALPKGWEEQIVKVLRTEVPWEARQEAKSIKLTTIQKINLAILLHRFDIGITYEGKISAGVFKAAKELGVKFEPILQKISDEEKAAAERKCEICGCTEKHACKDGCSWDPAFLAQKRYVCSACVDKGKTSLPAKKKVAGKSLKDLTTKKKAKKPSKK